MTDLEQKRVWWVSRVPETSTQAKAIIAQEEVDWQGSVALRWSEHEVSIGDRTERWIVVQSTEEVERQQATLQRRAEQDRQLWTKHLRELGQRTFACEADAQTALTEAQKGVPAWLKTDLSLNVSARYAGRGRPRTGVPPQQVWTVHGTISVVEGASRAEAERKAKFMVATNVPATHRSAEDLMRVYKAQNGVERGFAFLKDPLVLASSVFVKKIERVMATGFVMVLCLLIDRLAEQRLRQRLAETGASVSNQLKQPTQQQNRRLLAPPSRGRRSR
jgi:transposase